MNNPICPSCGGQKSTPVNDHEYRCEYCGHTFTPVETEKHQESQQFTVQPINNTQPSFQSTSNTQSNNTKSRVATAILALVFGGLGLHHFYLGNTTRGILYLLFCWTYIPTILSFIEGIMILLQSDDDFAKKPKLLF